MFLTKVGNLNCSIPAPTLLTHLHHVGLRIFVNLALSLVYTSSNTTRGKRIESCMILLTALYLVVSPAITASINT